MLYTIDWLFYSIIEDKSMATLNVRIDENLKKQAEIVFEEVGLTTSSAINIFFKQVVRTNSIPFELVADVPNKATRKAIKEAEIIAKSGQGYSDMDSLKKALKL